MLDIDGILEHDFRHEFDTHEDADHDFIACVHSMEGLDDSMFWFSFSDVEPELPDEVLRTIGRLGRLCRKRSFDQHGCVTPVGPSATSILQMDNLTARFVRTFRKKLKHREHIGCVVSRLVARGI